MANRGTAWTTTVQLLAENEIFSLPPCPDWFWGPFNLTNTVLWGCLFSNKEGRDKPTNHLDLVLRLCWFIPPFSTVFPWSLPNRKASYIFYLLISSCRWNVQSVETALQLMCQHKSHCSLSRWCGLLNFNLWYPYWFLSLLSLHYFCN